MLWDAAVRKTTQPGFEEYGDVFLVAVFDHLVVWNGESSDAIDRGRDTGGKFVSSNADMGDSRGHAVCAERQDGVSSGKHLARLTGGNSTCLGTRCLTETIKPVFLVPLLSFLLSHSHPSCSTLLMTAELATINP